METLPPRPSQFPILPKHEFDILAQILSSTPHNTTAFNALLSPYHQVLEKHGINHRTDERIYSLLLKLSLVTGLDWRQKWQRVFEEQRPNVIKNRDERLASVIPSHQRSSHTQTRHNSPASLGEMVVLPLAARRTPRLVQNPRVQTSVEEEPKAVPSNVVQPFRRKSVHFVASALDLGARPLNIPAGVLSSQLNVTSPHLVDKHNVVAYQFRHKRILGNALKQWKRNILRWKQVGEEVQRVRTLLDISVPYQVWRSRQRTITMQLRTVQHVQRER